MAITDKQMSSKAENKDKWFSETAIWGHGSLVGRITVSGERLFYFRYCNSQGTRITYPIGTYGREGREGYMTLAQASMYAKELAGLHKTGIRDIREHIESEQARKRVEQDLQLIQLQQEQAQKAARITVTTLFEHWLKVDLINRKDQGAEIKRMFHKDVLPLIGEMVVEDIKKGDITHVVDQILSRGVNRMAKLILSLMRQMFRFAVDRDIIEYDPTASIRKAKIGGRSTERDRILDDQEIKALAKQLPNAGLIPPTQLAVWICLTTCCRIGELLQAKWQDINWQEKIWTIPAEHSKNGKPHTIFLSNLALNYFKQLHQLKNHSTWCYPNRTQDSHVSTKTITKQISDRQRPEGQAIWSCRSQQPQALTLQGGKWTPHDLRRTGATIMTKLGVLPEVAERCLNHTEENKVKRVYQRHNYHKEMKEAWEELGKYIERLIE
ncbi:tyrosine-type recombinase/integrase [Entomomonas moraniae]|nr:tyrosine-type recombinase/integrase [Entomomonas moraniae]